MLNWVFYILSALLGFSFFTSKSAIAISGWLLFVTASFKTCWKDVPQKAPWLIAILALYPLAIVLNLFSLGGLKSALHTAGSLPFILFTLIFYVVWSDKKSKSLFSICALSSLLVACGYSFFLLFRDFNGVFTGSERVASFFDLSRWGLFAGVASLALYIGCFSPFKTRTRILSLICLLFALAAMITSGARAPMVGVTVSLLTLGLVADRKFLYGLGILAAVAFLLLRDSPALLHRVESITEVHTNKDGSLVSSDSSNTGRLLMWKIAGDFWLKQPFFGTGMENSKEPLKNFLAEKGDDYKRKYVIHNFSYNDQHNSYLNILVQFGLIYFILFFGVIGWVLYKAWDLKKLRAIPERQFAWAGIICFLIVGLFYGEIISFGSIMFWPLIPLLFYEPFPTSDR